MSFRTKIAQGQHISYCTVLPLARVSDNRLMKADLHLSRVHMGGCHLSRGQTRVNFPGKDSEMSACPRASSDGSPDRLF